MVYYCRLFNQTLKIKKYMRIWGLGIGDWGLGIGPNPQSPIPNPQSPIKIYQPNMLILQIITQLKILTLSLINIMKYKFKYFSQLSKPKYILLIGAPGAGKGTYGRLLSKDLKLPELSSGEEL